MSITPEKKVDSPTTNGVKKGGAGSFTPSALDSIREALLERRENLLRQQANQLNALNSPEKHHIADLEEMTTDAADADSLCTLVDLSSSTIDQIDAALEKLSNGAYGACEVCEKSISGARLEFLPFAALCVDCQRAQEAGGASPRVADGDADADRDA